MSTSVRIAGFVLGLVAVFVAARGVGAVVPPVHDGPAVHDVPAEERGGHGH